MVSSPSEGDGHPGTPLVRAPGPGQDPITHARQGQQVVLWHLVHFHTTVPCRGDQGRGHGHRPSRGLLSPLPKVTKGFLHISLGKAGSWVLGSSRSWSGVSRLRFCKEGFSSPSRPSGRPWLRRQTMAAACSASFLDLSLNRQDRCQLGVGQAGWLKDL